MKANGMFSYLISYNHVYLSVSNKALSIALHSLIHLRMLSFNYSDHHLGSNMETLYITKDFWKLLPKSRKVKHTYLYI